MIPLLKSLIFIALAVYLLGGLLLFLFQRTLLYHPTRPIQQAKWPLETLPVEGATLTYYVLHAQKPDAVLYFGGNNETVFYSADPFDKLFPDHAVYLINYRGYGHSSGSPNERALLSDALQLYDHLLASHRSVSVIGRSLGSGVACYLAAHRPVAGVVLITPFESIVRVAQHLFPIYPASWLVQERFASIRYAAQIQAPTLILTAEHDEIIPASHPRRLAEVLSDVRLAEVPEAGHNSIGYFPHFESALQAFFKSGS